MMAIEVFDAGHRLLGESPIWSVRQQCLFWIDSRAPVLCRRGLTDSHATEVAIPEVVGSIALLDTPGADQLLVALQSGLYRFDPRVGHLGPCLWSMRAAGERPDHRLNDGRVDPQGRFWVGSMSDIARDPVGTLYQIDFSELSHKSRRLKVGIIVPNSLAFDRDRGWAYFADTYAHTIWRTPWAIDGEEELDWHVWVQGPEQFVGRPDGSAIDADGCLWNCEYGGWRVTCRDRKGRVVDVIDLPVANPTCCAFGGPGYQTLFVTSARQRLSAEDLVCQPLAGCTFAIQTSTAGLEESRVRFGGMDS